MELNLVDKFVLLALDDDKGTFAQEPFALTYGLAGAILLELSFKEYISIVDKKVVLTSHKRIGDPFLDSCLERLTKSKKNKSLNYWVQTFGNEERSIKKEILEKLIRKGILNKREEKFLWFFNNDKFPTLNSKPENALRKRLFETLEHHGRPEVDQLMLISLIDTCKLNSFVYGKERAKKIKDRIKDVLKEAENNSLISDTIKEVQITILAMIVMLITTTTAVANSSN
ncbi:MAG: Golgi phosphoprotein 3 [Sediminicola sp.]|jgi:hypothetical protein